MKDEATSHHCPKPSTFDHLMQTGPHQWSLTLGTQENAWWTCEQYLCLAQPQISTVRTSGGGAQVGVLAKIQNNCYMYISDTQWTIYFSITMSLAILRHTPTKTVFVCCVSENLMSLGILFCLFYLLNLAVLAQALAFPLLCLQCLQPHPLLDEFWLVSFVARKRLLPPAQPPQHSFGRSW